MKKNPVASGRSKQELQKILENPRASEKRRQLAASDLLELQEIEKKASSKLSREKSQAKKATDAYKVKKSDKGKLVFIGFSGQRSPQLKGRKGFTIYVSNTGKKSFLKDSKNGYRPQKFRDVEIKTRKNLHKKIKTFELSRMELIKQKRTYSVKRYPHKTRCGGADDFSERVVNEISSIIKKRMDKQESRRIFQITAIAQIAVPGEKELLIVQIAVTIARADYVAIEQGGIEEFVRRKFWSAIARELEINDYVTRGSANHIRRLSVNAGQVESDFVQDFSNEEKRRLTKDEMDNLKRRKLTECRR